MESQLPDEIEHICPDYTFGGIDYSLGFLTRGCIRSCPWCVVPEKEGNIYANADIEEFCRHKNVILMDNNVLALEHGIQQIEKMASLGLRVDFNQGIDARLIDKQIAKRLAKLHWLKPLRLACDNKSQMPIIEKAVGLLKEADVRPKNYSCYVLIQDIDDAVERVMFLSGLGIDPFAQPYIPPHTPVLPSGIDAEKRRNLARWVNHKAIFKSVRWNEYRSNKLSA
jgi:hypothetical protein